MSVQKLTTDEAKKIFIRYMPNLPKEVQVALKFTLSHWKIFKSIEDINNLESKITATEAKIFLASLPSLPTDDNNLDKVFIDRLNTATYALRNEPSIWLSSESLPHEIWRDVVNYGGLYKVSNFGRVKSFKYKREYILRQSTSRQGYLLITLYNDKNIKIGVHVLVAEAFLPNPQNKPVVHHKNDIKNDNFVWNLRWATYSENIKWAWESGARKYSPTTELHHNSKLTPEQVRYIRKYHIPRHHEFGASALARTFKVTKNVILNIVKHKSYRNVT